MSRKPGRAFRRSPRESVWRTRPPPVIMAVMCPEPRTTRLPAMRPVPIRCLPLLFTVFLTATAWPGLASAPARAGASEDDVGKLIDRLGSDEAAQREKAAGALEALGEKALDP